MSHLDQEIQSQVGRQRLCYFTEHQQESHKHIIRSEHERPASDHDHKPSIKPGCKPTVSMSTEFRVIDQTSDCLQHSDKRVSL